MGRRQDSCYNFPDTFTCGNYCIGTVIAVLGIARATSCQEELSSRPRLELSVKRFPINPTRYSG